MNGTTKQVVGTMVLTTGVLTVFNSFELHAVGPFWLGGAVMIVGVALAVLGWKLILRGRSDVALEASRHNDEQVDRRRAHPADEDPRTQHPEAEDARSADAESSLEDPRILGSCSGAGPHEPHGRPGPVVEGGGGCGWTETEVISGRGHRTTYPFPARPRSGSMTIRRASH